MPATSTSPAYARVAVPAPLHGLFDYRIPGELAGAIKTGIRVEVPFGRRKVVGVVTELCKHSDHPANRLKAVAQILDAIPCLPADIVQLLNWSAGYYQHAIGEVYQSALPARLRQGKANVAKQETCWFAAVKDQQQTLASLTRAPKQHRLMQQVYDQPGITNAQLNSVHENWRPAMQALLQKALVTKQTRDEHTEHDLPEAVVAPSLNLEQQHVVHRIGEQLQHHAVHLLHGVTGSGKTEVYIRLAQASITAGKQVLLLVPEISLTPQLTERFQQRLGYKVGILHSALNDVERHRIWHATSQGKLSMLIGTRSAVFTPMPQLGLIIIDEEHDNSYKQQDGFRYHARDVAIVRAKNADVPVLLGSATPSLESLYNTEQKRYHIHQLTQRAASKHQTRVELIDMRRQPIIEGLSEKLLNNIAHHLARGNQVMLFLNRRGFAPLLLCHQCGWTTRCKRCDAHMTYHKNKGRLRCHHCDSEMAVPQQCDDCGSDELIALGSGTERIEHALSEHFANTNIVRIDRDTTRRKGSLQQKLKSVKSGAAQILIGTQMLAKGHDFPDVTLVGILDTDQALHSADFRAPEHLAQLIVQVAGRAGRASKAGEVQIQTHHPDHPLLQTLLHHGYQAFCESALQERAAAMLPPYNHMMILRAEAHHTDQMYKFMYEAINHFKQQSDDNTSIFGPVAAPMEKRAGRYRSQIILQSAQRKPLHMCMRHTLPKLMELKSARKVRWSIDVDPVDTY